ncbi:MAG: hypothetical protein ACI31V_00310 [Bacilli bacterium]
MNNNIEELREFEQKMYANLINNYNIERDNNIAKTFRSKLEKKQQTINMIKQQIKFLTSESLDLTSEISRLISEIEMKSIYER